MFHAKPHEHKHLQINCLKGTGQIRRERFQSLCHGLCHLEHTHMRVKFLTEPRINLSPQPNTSNICRASCLQVVGRLIFMRRLFGLRGHIDKYCILYYDTYCWHIYQLKLPVQVCVANCPLHLRMCIYIYMYIGPCRLTCLTPSSQPQRPYGRPVRQGSPPFKFQNC